jgi:methylmalonyl-CoA/ethylmalonyl-CoA epimerase
MKVHHVGIAVPSIAIDGKAYCDALGLPPYGEVTADEIQQVRVAFVRVNDVIQVEFIEPLGPDSPVQGVLRRGGGVYHICYEVADIESAIARARESGGMLVSGPVPAAAFNGRRIAFCYVANSLLEFVEQPA